MNEALDNLLTGARLQEEFLLKTKLLTHTLRLAQPIKLSTVQERRIKTLQTLEHHVKILTPSYLSDHIIDSSAEDSYLLHDIAESNNLVFSDIDQLVRDLRRLGHEKLAQRVEARAGFIRLPR